MNNLKMYTPDIEKFEPFLKINYEHFQTSNMLTSDDEEDNSEYSMINLQFD